MLWHLSKGDTADDWSLKRWLNLLKTWLLTLLSASAYCLHIVTCSLIFTYDEDTNKENEQTAFQYIDGVDWCKFYNGNVFDARRSSLVTCTTRSTTHTVRSIRHRTPVLAGCCTDRSGSRLSRCISIRNCGAQQCRRCCSWAQWSQWCRLCTEDCHLARHTNSMLLKRDLLATCHQ